MKKSKKLTIDPDRIGIAQLAESSIELSRDAKGVPRWCIKVFGDKGDLTRVLKQIITLDKRIRKHIMVESPESYGQG